MNKDVTTKNAFHRQLYSKPQEECLVTTLLLECGNLVTALIRIITDDALHIITLIQRLGIAPNLEVTRHLIQKE